MNRSSRHLNRWIAFVALLFAPAALADPCCVAQMCSDRTPADCTTSAGILGHCRVGQPCGAPGCDLPSILPITDLKAVKGGADLWLTWTPDANAAIYDAHSVTDKRDIPDCAATGAPLPGSAPTTIAEAIDRDALLPSAQPIVYYCSEGGCPAPTGACCSLGLCDPNKTQADCLGAYLGDGSTCPNAGCQAVADVGPCLVGGNVLYLDGDPTEFIHPGVDTITMGDFFGSTTGPDHVRFFVLPTLPSQGSYWRLDLTSRNLLRTLDVGVYERAGGYPFEPPGQPGMDFSGDSRACDSAQRRGRFQIHEIDLVGPTIFRLTAAWEMTCDAMPGAWLRGCIHFEP